MKLLSKIFSLFCLLACFAACEDIPMPYEPQTEDDDNDSTIYYSSASLYNGWTLVKIGDNQPWSQGSSYTQATGYQKWDGAADKSNRAAEGLLISPAFKTNALKTGKVKISFDNCVGYAQNDAAFADHIKLLISKGASTSSYNAEEWKELNWKATHTSTDWTLTKDEVQLPDEYVNQENVRIAYWFVTGSADKSVTFELKNFVIEEGVAGEGGDDDPAKPKGSGTKDDPYNIAGALAYTSALAADTNSDPIYITGYVTSFKSGEEPGNSYGNATYYLADTPEGTTTFLVYRGMSYGGAKFSSADELQTGDLVVIQSPVVNFKGNTPETVSGKAQIITINGKAQDGGEDTPPTPAGESSKENPYTVAQALTASGYGYVKGYIVGYVDGKTLSEGARFSADGAVETNILIADKAGETDLSKCMPVQLPAGAIRDALKLTNASNLGKQATLYGSFEKYFGTAGLKSVTWALLDGKNIGKDPDVDEVISGTPKGTGTETDPYNVAGVLKYIATLGADKNSPSEVYISGTVTNVKEISVQYGNATFTLSDDASGSNSFMVYRCMSFGGEKFTDDKAVKVGDKVIVKGLVVNYKGNTPETVQNQASLYSVNGATKIRRHK